MGDGCRLNRAAYESLIRDDLAWLASLPTSLERDHVRLIVERSAAHEYPAVTNRIERDIGEDIETLQTAFREIRSGGRVDAAISMLTRTIQGLIEERDAAKLALPPPAPVAASEDEPVDYRALWHRDVAKGRAEIARLRIDAQAMREWAVMFGSVCIARHVAKPGETTADRQETARLVLDTCVPMPSLPTPAPAVEPSERERLPVLTSCGGCSQMRTYGMGPVSGGPDRGAYCGSDAPFRGAAPYETWVNADAAPPSWCPLRSAPLAAHPPAEEASEVERAAIAFVNDPTRPAVNGCDSFSELLRVARGEHPAPEHTCCRDTSCCGCPSCVACKACSEARAARANAGAQ